MKKKPNEKVKIRERNIKANLHLKFQNNVT